MEIPVGERHAIIGPNGAGKSTLFNLVSGRLAPSRGSIALNGDEIAGLRPFHIARRGLARSFQVTNIFPRLTVFENVRCALLWPLGHRYDCLRGVDRSRDVNDRAAQVLAQIGLAARREAQAGGRTYPVKRKFGISIAFGGVPRESRMDVPTPCMCRRETEPAILII